jgi:hypothetical protein
MPNDPSRSFMDPACKDRLLGVLQREVDAVFDLTSDPDRWEAPTACERATASWPAASDP